MNAARTNWFDRSAMKFRTSRGPYVDDVVASTEIVIENDVPATVSIEVPIVVRIERPPLALRASRTTSGVPRSTRVRSMVTRTWASTIAAMPRTAGRNQKDSRTRRLMVRTTRFLSQ